VSSPISIGQASLNTRPHALYRFYDRTDVLLYVGITADLPKRMKNHQKEKPWWLQISTIKIEPYETRSEVFEAEAEAIRTENPLYNSTHNTFVAMAPVSPEQAVAEYAKAIMGRLNLSDDEIAEYLAELDEQDDWEAPYPLPKIASAALIAVEEESGGRLTLEMGALRIFEQLEPQTRSDFEQQAIAEARRWGIEVEDGTDDPEVLEGMLNRVAAMLARQYLDSLDAAEATEWLACASALQPKSGKDSLTRQAALFARQRKHSGTVPAGMCMESGQHGANCPSMAAFDIQYACEKGHVSGWARFCADHTEMKQREGVTHLEQDCGADARVSVCEPTQTPDWGWV